MEICTQDQRHANLHAPELNVRTALRGVVQQVAAGCGRNNCSRLLSKAWAILLDLDAADTSEVLQDVPDREQHNRIAAAQACLNLQQNLRGAEASRLGELLQQWQSIDHYQPWAPGVPQDFDDIPSPAPLKEHQAVLSVLFALQGSAPEPWPTLTALPALGSSTLAAVQQRAAAAVAAAAAGPQSWGASAAWRLSWLEQADAAVDVQQQQKYPAAAMQQKEQQQQQQEKHHVAAGLQRLAEYLQEQQQAAAAGTWLSTAAAATQLLEQMPLDAAADACKSNHADKPKSSTVAMHPMVDCLTKQLQLASQPHLLRPLGLAADAAAASDTAAGSSSDQGCRKARNNSNSSRVSSRDQDVTQAAVDAAAAVASAAAQRSGVLPLMMLSAAEVGSGAAHMLPSQQQQQQQDAVSTARAAPGHHQQRGPKASNETCHGSKLLNPARARGATAANCAAAAAVAAPPSAAAARAAAEQELASLSCLAVQGVWSAVGQLWSMAAAPPEASSSNRLVGLARSPAQQQLLAQVLHIAELRLRLQAFLHHFAGAAAAAATLQGSSSSSANDANGAAEQLENAGIVGEGGSDNDVSSQPVLQAFLSAVKEVLDMHDAAMQLLLYQQQQRSKQLAAAAAASAAAGSLARSPPATTLLQLVAQLRSMREQLQQLAQCCWCTPCIAADGTAIDPQAGVRLPANVATSTSSSSSSTAGAACRTTTERLLILGSRSPKPSSSTKDASASTAAAAGFKAAAAASAGHLAAAAAAEARAAAEKARAAALPWPGAAAAAYADCWGWDPSRWQLLRGFSGGAALLECLYEGLLHAGPQTAPLLRHLFAAALQPQLHTILTWAFQPELHAAEAAAAAAAMSSVASGSSSSWACTAGAAAAAALTTNPSTAQAGFGSRFTSTSSCKLRQPHPSRTAGSSSSSGSGDRAVQAASSALLLQAWQAAQSRAPSCPSFLGGVREAAVVAGLQLQLLQLLGGPGQQLAERLGWLAELEHEELRELLAGSSSSSSSNKGAEFAEGGSSSHRMACGDAAMGPAAAAAAGDIRHSVAGAGGLHLLLGGGGLAAAAGCLGGMQDAAAAAGGGVGGGAAGLGGQQGRVYVPFSLSMRQLKHAAAVVSDFEAARQLELAKVVSSLAAARAAGDAAAQAWLESRQLDKAAAEQQRLQLQQSVAARKRQRQRQLLLQQQEEMAVAVARRRSSKQQELALERSLLAQSAAAEHKNALQLLHLEAARAARVGLDLPAFVTQRVLQTENAARTATTAAAEQAEPAAAAVLAAAEGANANEACAAAAELVPPSSPFAAAARISDEFATAAGGGVSGGAADTSALQQQWEQGAPADHTDAEHQQQQHGKAAAGHKRPTWGAPVDPTPAAGAASAAAKVPPLAIIGSRAASAIDPAALPAAGRRSNLKPRVLAGQGSTLTSPRSRPSSPTPAAHGAAGSGGGLGFGSRRPSASELLQQHHQQQQQQQQQQQPSKWGPPVYATPAAGLPSAQRQLHRRAASWGPEQADTVITSNMTQGLLQQQQQQHGVHRQQWQSSMGQHGPLLLSQVAGAGASASAAAASDFNAYTVTQEDVLLQLMDDADEAATGDASHAVLPVSVAVTNGTSRGHQLQPQEQQDHLQQQQQQQQQGGGADAADSSAPLITMLEVLVVWPLLAQHRLTTLACWQLLLQDQRLLQRLASLQALFFQQQGDWVDLLLEALQQQQQHLMFAPDNAAAASAPASGAVRLSPVAAQLLLESAVQQSCLAGEPDAERMSMTVDVDRTLPGWSSSSGSNTLQHAPEAATDALVLTYDVPWPVNLLAGEQQLQQYAAVFSVLLRLRRLQQQLTSQWAALNSRAGSSSSSSSRHGAASSRTDVPRSGRSSSSSLRIPVSRRQSQQDDAAAEAQSPAAAAADMLRLQQLRRWHALALNCVTSVLGGMLSDLSGQLWAEFEAEVSTQPVSLPAIIAAHDRLLAAAQQVCLLPPQQGLDKEKVSSSTGHSQLAGTVYRLVAAAWQLQQQVQQLLSLSPDTTSSSSSSSSTASTGACREGVSAGCLAQLLLQREGSWQGCAAAGAGLEGLLLSLKRQLAGSRAGQVGHSMAGLVARLGLLL
uniref:Gamma tubulin complex component C-terminal domain-containing protein n=1 Tax=Tetradesmus obliquus TaxID=3088 RepID=A0A383VBK2_TETOB|eukprot:jgi/Sobl393_1/12457/SZX62571.1